MIIGTDCSLDVCKNEGYFMMQYDARKKFDADAYYRVFQYAPDYVDDNKRRDTIVDVEYTFNDLVELYQDKKNDIDSCCETYLHINFDTPTYRDFLNLASDIGSYCGL